ncbi:MAG: septum formation protein Maf [Ruminococcaceae bacterium]|nr:septum formation protein Maf [Oscillospiraceae bacterium]
MLSDSYRVILASASPRRRDLLSNITTEFEIIVSDAEEIIPEDVTPFGAAAMLSSIKAESIAKGIPAAKIEGSGTIIIGADTVVAFNGMILGKPKSEKEAFFMLYALQGKTHQVFTGVTIVLKTPVDDFRCTFTECTSVTVAPMTEDEINEYIATCDSMDKAGAYGIQGCFSKYVERIDGDYNNVVGLPVTRLNKEINNLLSKLV